MTDPISDIIQISVRMERARVLSILIREAKWLRLVMEGQPSAEQSAMRREIDTIMDLVADIERG